MMRQEWRTDYSSLLDPWADDRPSPSDLADDNPGDGPGYTREERAALVADLEAAQRNARRNAYPITRCDNNWCRTTVDLGDDPMALCDYCGYVTCAGCGTCDCGGDAA